MAEDKKLNNLDTGSKEGTTKDKTEGDKKDEGGKELIGGKFESQEDLLQAYQQLEAGETKKSQELADTKDRVTKLEGMAEAQRKEPPMPAMPTKEEMEHSNELFKGDFNTGPLMALHNQQQPIFQRLELIEKENQMLRESQESMGTAQEKRDATFQAGLARQEDPELFDKFLPEIQKELSEDKNLANYENPYEAAFNKVAGRSYKKLAKMSDAEREAHLEGPSSEPPTDKSTKGSRYKDYVMKHSKRRTVL